MPTTVDLVPITVTKADVFGAGQGPEPFLELGPWDRPVTFFVGRNGSGKSKAAKAVAGRLPNTRFLSTDRLVGLMAFRNYAWGSIPADYRGVPLDKESRAQIEQVSFKSGAGTDELYALREQPEVWLRVAAFVRRALHRSIELRESAGFLDPFVRLGATEYSLLRDEGHGLREVVILLAAIYRNDWSLLIVDEPELHLHPSLARLWLSELEAECASSGRRAIVITHEPLLVNPGHVDDLASLILFLPGDTPKSIRSCVEPGLEARVTASLQQNPSLVSQLVFSPRPVLLEGALDVLALNLALRRSQPPEVVAQTDLIDCGGNGALAVWFSIARKAGLDVRAVGDLDCCLDQAVTRTIDSMQDIAERYQLELYMEPPRTSTVVRPLLDTMRSEGVPADPKRRAQWLAADMGKDAGHIARRDKLLDIWRDAGLWLHAAGTLEQVLGVSEADKNRESIIEAAGHKGEIDVVAEWASYRLDPSGDVFDLLSAAVEHMAHAILEALRLSPDARFNLPVGTTSAADSRIADVSFDPERGMHRITIKLPAAFAGYWVEFDRDTAPTAMVLSPPNVGGLPGA